MGNKITLKIISVPVNGSWEMEEIETLLPSCGALGILPGGLLTNMKKKFSQMTRRHSIGVSRGQKLFPLDR